tara:strand:+ start:282 stop:422 length:141 start_codon:yes stop_codon:yes gene_type:complete
MLWPFFTHLLFLFLPTIAVFLIFGSTISTEDNAVDAKLENEAESSD